MKIAYDHQAFCMQAYGGISRYHVRLAEHLALIGEDVAVFAPVHRNRYLPALPPSRVRGFGIRRYRIPGSRTMMRINESLARRQINRWQPQLVHETYYCATGMAPTSCPTVITVHDMTHELFPEHFRSTDNTSALKRKAVNRADHIICVSESTRSDLVRLFGTPAEKTTVVHLGMAPLVATASQDDSVVNKKPFILFVGQREGYKNFRGLLQAVANSSRLRTDFDIVAFGGSSFRSREKTEIKHFGFADEQVRHITGSDLVLATLYGQASVLVYPSLYEGFGLPPLEAMSLGCPVVSSCISSMPEILGTAAEFFESGSHEALQVAMETVLYSDERAGQLRRLGKTRAGEFTWESCATRSQAVYSQFAP